MARYIDADKLGVVSIDITDLPTDHGLMCYLAEDVDNALAEDVRPIVRGKWIAEYDKSDGHFRTYHCSNCENLQGYTSNFCEECGSENREVEE